MTASATPTPILEVTDVSKRFHLRGGYQVHALHRVSINVDRGETLAVVGESGSGKTTLGRTLLRLMDPDEGSITFMGQDITHASRRSLRPVRQHLGLISQDPFASLNPRKRVGVSVAEPLRIHHVGGGSEIWARVADIFERVGLSMDDMKRYPHEFSGGQRQRICVARAMILRPAMIVADEPTSALDVRMQASILNLLLDLQNEFTVATVFISHDLAIVERLAHKVAVMRLGQVVEAGTRRAIFEDPRHSYTRALMAAVPIPDPSKRRAHTLLTDDMKSPVWPRGQGPEILGMEQVSPLHFVARETSAFGQPPVEGMSG